MNHGHNHPLLHAGQILGAFGDNYRLAGRLAPLTGTWFCPELKPRSPDSPKSSDL